MALSLYVWDKFLTGGSGMVLAVAHTEEEAKQLIVKELGCEPIPEAWNGWPKIFSLSKKEKFAIVKIDA